MRFAASRIASTSAIVCPERTSASGMFGVTISARGRRLAFIVVTASSSRRRVPLLETITGSTTRLGARCLLSAAATAWTMAVLASMPVLTASKPMSWATASICAATTSGSILWMRVTPTVFCAVTAVIADVPNTPRAPNVLRSAWMPAPPPESEPATVRARFIGSPQERVGATISNALPGSNGRARTRSLGARRTSGPPHLGDDTLQGARGGGDILGRDDGGHDGRPPGAGLEHTGRVLDRDPSDGHHGDGHGPGDP